MCEVGTTAARWGGSYWGVGDDSSAVSSASLSGGDGGALGGAGCPFGCSSSRLRNFFPPAEASFESE